VAVPTFSPDRPIRLGIIGTGLAVKRLHWPVLRQMPDRFTIAGFANRTRATAEEFAAMADLSMDAYVADYQSLLRRADIETVLVCVPIAQSLAITRDSLAAGKHVICEKPPGVDLSEALQFLALEAQYSGQRLSNRSLITRQVSTIDHDCPDTGCRESGDGEAVAHGGATTEGCTGAMSSGKEPRGARNPVRSLGLRRRCGVPSGIRWPLEGGVSGPCPF
jgi:GFO/IDH/MocA oxidoreductase family protein